LEIRQEAPSISTKKDQSESCKKNNLIIDAVVDEITKSQPKMELQRFTKKKGTRELHQDTGGKEERMDKQQDIRSKKEPEVSSLKKSDSTTKSESQYCPINEILPPDLIKIPMTFLDHETVRPKVLAIEIQDSSQDKLIKPKSSTKENVLVLTNNTQGTTSKDYSSRQSQPSQAAQKVRPPAAKSSADDLPNEAASPSVIAAQPISKSPAIAEIPCMPSTWKYHGKLFLEQ
jgi:hypothetical protein